MGMMIGKKEQDIQFYRGEAVQEFLKKLDLSVEEKKHIQAAIKTAKSDEADISLIVKADKMIDAAQKRGKTGTSQFSSKEAKKSIATIELMKLKQEKKVGAPILSRMTMGTKTTIVIALVLGAVVYIRDHSPGNSTFTFTEAQEYCAEQGKLLPLTLEDDPQHLLNLYALEGKAYWSAKGGLLYNMDVGRQSYAKDAKHYVICVDENGKTAGTPIGAKKVEYYPAKEK